MRTNWLIVDTQTGTVLDANTCRVVDVDTLPDEALETLEYGDDDAAGVLATVYGRPITGGDR